MEHLGEKNFTRNGRYERVSNEYGKVENRKRTLEKLTAGKRFAVENGTRCKDLGEEFEITLLGKGIIHIHPTTIM
jgi:hypothetical protein